MDGKDSATEYLILLMEVPRIIDCPKPDCPQCKRNTLWARVAEEMLIEGTYSNRIKDVVIEHVKRVRKEQP